MARLVAMGAEARIYEETFFGLDAMRKVRASKAYRATQLDEKLRITRTAREAKAYARAKKYGVPCPCVLDVHGAEMVLERIEGTTLRDEVPSVEGLELRDLAQRIGWIIGRMHSAGLVHNDLTGVNLIVAKEGGEVYLIDFGLARFSSADEDRAVDLHVLKQSVLVSCPEKARFFFDGLEQGYERGLGEGARSVMSRLGKVEKRGRYRK